MIPITVVSLRERPEEIVEPSITSAYALQGAPIKLNARSELFQATSGRAMRELKTCRRLSACTPGKILTFMNCLRTFCRLR